MICKLCGKEVTEFIEGIKDGKPAIICDACMIAHCLGQCDSCNTIMKSSKITYGKCPHCNNGGHHEERP